MVRTVRVMDGEGVSGSGWRPWGKRLGVVGAVAVVVLVQGVLQFLLYGELMVERSVVLGSELLVFGGPMVFALLALGWVFLGVAAGRGWTKGKRVGFVVGMTGVFWFVSTWASLVLPMNVFGS